MELVQSLQSCQNARDGARASQQFQDSLDSKALHGLIDRERNCKSVLDLIEGGRIPQLRRETRVLKSIFIPPNYLPSLRVSFPPIQPEESLTFLDVVCIVPPVALPAPLKNKQQQTSMSISSRHTPESLSRFTTPTPRPNQHYQLSRPTSRLDTAAPGTPSYSINSESMTTSRSTATTAALGGDRLTTTSSINSSRNNKKRLPAITMNYTNTFPRSAAAAGGGGGGGGTAALSSSTTTTNSHLLKGTKHASSSSSSALGILARQAEGATSGIIDSSLGVQNKQNKPPLARENEELSESSARMARAMEMMNMAKRSPESSRSFFEAAILFDIADVHERALTCFLNARRSGSLAAIVDSVHVTNDVGHERKLERMSVARRTEFLRCRAELREKYIVVERERFRLRSFISILQVTRLHLLLGNFSEAHSSLCDAFENCSTEVENSFTLHFMHGLLSSMSINGFEELDLRKQIYSETPGSLGEAHIKLLNELLEDDPDNPDYIEWLGRRHAELGDFSASRNYYKTQRQYRPHEAVDLPIDRAKPLNLSAPTPPVFGKRAKGILATIKKSEEELQAEKQDSLQRMMDALPPEKALRKRAVEVYHTENDRQIDESNRNDRADYTYPEGLHHESNTYIYSVPANGWTFSLKFEPGAPPEAARL